jgi:hypothetical protein
MNLENACITAVVVIAAAATLIRFAISECEGIVLAWRKFSAVLKDK